mmetsp:Transcript_16442/g.33195  ORF Transcript_16442/g.33195 Transcript_16442/m.33195 type:complete len:299 (-) Transcript_16442:253-1149(-)
MATDDAESFPPLRKPSQSYVDNYIARSGATPAPRTAALTPRQGPARKAARIFYPLEDKCPVHYYPDLHLVNDVWMVRTRRALQLMCTMQVVMSVVLLLYSGSLHNEVDKTFTCATNLLGIFAAMLGFVGILLNYRTLLLFLYINELFGLSNVCTVFLMRLDDNHSSMVSCEMLDRGELSQAQVTEMGLDCDEVRSTQHAIVVMMSVLLAQLWLTCLLSKTYMEMVQDHLNDGDDHALIDFIWERRRETWIQLRRFEDVVQRQFEELRSSLVNRHGSKRDFAANMSVQPTPSSSTSPRT